MTLRMESWHRPGYRPLCSLHFIPEEESCCCCKCSLSRMSERSSGGNKNPSFIMITLRTTYVRGHPWWIKRRAGGDEDIWLNCPKAGNSIHHHLGIITFIGVGIEECGSSQKNRRFEKWGDRGGGVGSSSIPSLNHFLQQMIAAILCCRAGHHQ